MKTETYRNAEGALNNVTTLFALGALALVAVIVVSSALRQVVNVLTPELRQQQLTQAVQLAPWNLAVAVTFRVAVIMLLLGLAAGCIAALSIGLSAWYIRTHQRVTPQAGLFPLILNHYGWHNINPPPAQIAAALGASGKVQWQLGALSTPPALPAPVENQAEHAWPDIIPARSVVEHASLEHLVIGIALDDQGQEHPVTGSLHHLMHTLVVGVSGWGKSTWLRFLLWQIAQSSERIGIMAIDINGSEFNLLRGWDKLLYPVARETAAAERLLGAFQAEAQRRMALYEAHPLAVDLPSYQRLTGDKLAPWLLIIDEGTNLLNQRGIGEHLRTAVQTTRQYGMYVLMAGQTAKASVIDTQTRDNFSTRLCYRTSRTSMRVALDQTLPEIDQKGRAYALLAGAKVQLLHTPFVSREELDAVLTRTTAPLPEPEGLPPAEHRRQRVLELAAQGYSRAEIERAACGYAGGSAFEYVRQILGPTATTTTEIAQ